MPSDRAREDYHDPTAGIGGAPAARSALTLRLVLALGGAVVCIAGAVIFATAVVVPVLCGVLAFFAVVAVIDAAVVISRKRRGEPG